MKICINGIGNIGTTLALILNDYRNILGISELICYKNHAKPWQKTDLNFLLSRGIKIYYAEDIPLMVVLQDVDFVFDTTTNGMGLVNRDLYIEAKHLKGVIAQGSEKDFGRPFMSGINQCLKSEKLVQIVSCNTHGAASILWLLAGENLSDLVSADFVVVRRSEDLSNHERLVSANVVARHLSPLTGTHHAIDVKDLFKSMAINCNITSSDITTPSQLMHSTRFNIVLKNKIDINTLQARIKSSTLINSTSKFDSNQVFELGRRYGKYGRIFNHAIVIDNNILCHQNSIKGWAFIPQEGNTIISTIEAYAHMIDLPNLDQSINFIKKELLVSEW